MPRHSAAAEFAARAVRRACLALLAAAAIALTGQAAWATTVIVDANNPAPGDDFTSSTTSNTTPLDARRVLGTTGWTYNNVRNNGHVGVNTDFPKAATARSGSTARKARLATVPRPTSSTSAPMAWQPRRSMGTLGDITALAYDWYKSSASTASQQSNLRIYVDADGNLSTTNDQGYLVFERAYQPINTVPTDQWVSDNVIGANLWEVYFGHGNFDTAGNFQPLSVWGSAGGFTPSGGGLHLDANSVIFGLNAGIGSGWGTYVGTVDNITIGFNGNDPTTTNFEVTPEPSTWVMAATALVGLGTFARSRRRRQAR